MDCVSNLASIPLLCGQVMVSCMDCMFNIIFPACVGKVLSVVWIGCVKYSTSWLYG